ncbi:conserved hypothetical protein [Ricinus communis]|uniref:Uncharacterized protein n=1 Tax=Ricinus communis TaxID=3988 RepID=B9RY31_RICCO|nr:conserved hypothetical protein [Ricinus communis]
MLWRRSCCQIRTVALLHLFYLIDLSLTSPLLRFVSFFGDKDRYRARERERERLKKEEPRVSDSSYHLGSNGLIAVYDEWDLYVQWGLPLTWTVQMQPPVQWYFDRKGRRIAGW